MSSRAEPILCIHLPEQQKKERESLLHAFSMRQVRKPTHTTHHKPTNYNDVMCAITISCFGWHLLHINKLNMPYIKHAADGPEKNGLRDKIF